MFKNYEEARDYARDMSREKSGYVGIVMVKDGKYNVAADYDEVDYAEGKGWRVA